MRVWLFRRGTPIFAVLAMCAVPFFSGCGPSATKITGTVNYKGKPLTGGIVTFFVTEGKGNPISATFGEDGRFEATVPNGTLSVAVDNRSVKGSTAPIGMGSDLMGGAKNAMPGKGPPADAMKLPPGAAEKAKEAGKTGMTGSKTAGTYVQIPEKYYQASTSGKTVTIDSSTKDVMIDLD